MVNKIATTPEPGNRVALITGATGAIGSAIATGVAARGYRVVMVCRDAQKAKQAAADIVNATGNAEVSFELADLSRRAEVQALADRWQGPLDVLINNAAIAPPQRKQTPEGIELQFATNVLGYFWLSLAFRNHLAMPAHARIVNVASYWAGDLALDDLEFKHRPYDNNCAYRQSKQANRMLTVAFANLFRDDGVSVNACHPGDVNSRLSNELGFGGFESPHEGAATPIWLATDDGIALTSGKYFERKRQTRCRFGENTKAVDALFRRCLEYDTPT